MPVTFHIHPDYSWHCGSHVGVLTTDTRNVTCPACLKAMPVDRRDFYRFPRVRFAGENGPHSQLQHVLSEARELEQAYGADPAINVAMEALDLIHSTETFLRIWIDRNPDHDISVLHDLVVEKNRQRGYY